MKNNIFIVNEFERKIAYAYINGQIYRREIYNINDLLNKLDLLSYEDGIKKDIIKEVTNQNNELQKLRSLLVKKQLDNNFLNSLSNPIDDDSICNELFEQLVLNEKKRSNMRNSRLKSDLPNKYVPARNLELIEAKLFSKLLNNIEYLKTLKYNFNISDEGMKKLIHHANDLIYLQKILKPFSERRESANTVIIYEHELKLQQDHLPDSLAISREKYHSIYPELFSYKKEDISQIANFYTNLLNLKVEHIGNQAKNTYRFGMYSNYDARIYFNNHNEEILSQFIEVYINECINQNIPYNIKGLYNSHSITDNDTTVFYTDFKDLTKHIQIIEKILLNHPEWRKSFNSPVYGASRFGTGFYGITSAGGINNHQIMETGNNYYENIFQIAYYCMLSKVLLENNLINPSDQCWNYVNELYQFKNLQLNPNNTAAKTITINNEKKIEKIIPQLQKYITPKVNQKILKLGYKEFRNLVYKIHSLCQHLPLNTKMNISISKIMNEYFSKKNNTTDKKTTILDRKKTFWNNCQLILEATKHSEKYDTATNIQLLELANFIEKECLTASSDEIFFKTYMKIEKKINTLLKIINKQEKDSETEENIKNAVYDIRRKIHQAQKDNDYKLLSLLRECHLIISKISSTNINENLLKILTQIIHYCDSYTIYRKKNKSKQLQMLPLNAMIIKINELKEFTSKKPNYRPK